MALGLPFVVVATLQAKLVKRLRDRARKFVTTAALRALASQFARTAAALARVLPGALEDYEIDHKRALSTFPNLRTDPAEQLEAFGPSNHQWLRRGHNRSKGAR